MPTSNLAGFLEIKTSGVEFSTSSSLLNPGKFLAGLSRDLACLATRDRTVPTPSPSTATFVHGYAINGQQQLQSTVHT